MGNDHWMDERNKGSAFDRQVAGVRQTQARIQAVQQQKSNKDWTTGAFSSQPLSEKQGLPASTSSAAHLPIQPAPPKPEKPREMTEEELYKKALEDPLTPAFNFRYTLRRLQYELTRASFFGGEVGVMVVAIDRMMAIAIEHSPGLLDKCLESVYATLAAICRPVDLIGRYNEGRFLVVCPQMPRDHLAMMAEDVRKVCEATVVQHQWDNFKLSVSIGLVESSEELNDVESLIAVADLGADMITEKGGNGYCFATEQG
ncbi:MAG TPA: GGDEF domain-containing protein [Trichormus sp.]|jgi:diguanylate cyclase (GGDEF)-like protein